MCHASFIVFIATNKCTINTTTVSLYMIHTPTCFNVYMLSSGTFTLLSCQVTYVLKIEAVKITFPPKFLKCIKILFNHCLVIQ